MVTRNRACILLHNTILTGIRIAFETVEYTVSESTGKVKVTVSTKLVLNFAPVTVQVSSENGSARGKAVHV